MKKYFKEHEDEAVPYVNTRWRFSSNAAGRYLFLSSLPPPLCLPPPPLPGGQSFFSRKDSIRTIYTSLYNELRKLMTAGGRHSQPGSASYLEDLLSHLSEQLCHFTQARVEMADLYEKMHSLGGQKSVNSEELVATLEAVLHKYSSKCVPVLCLCVPCVGCVCICVLCVYLCLPCVYIFKSSIFYIIFT